MIIQKLIYTSIVPLLQSRAINHFLVFIANIKHTRVLCGDLSWKRFLNIYNLILDLIGTYTNTYQCISVFGISDEYQEVRGSINRTLQTSLKYTFIYYNFVQHI